MNKLAYFVVAFFIVVIALTLFLWGSSSAKNTPFPTAQITGIGMMEGDDPSWRQRDFNSTDWPRSQSAGNGFNRVLIPKSIAWLRTAPFSLPNIFRAKPIALYVDTGASFEVFWNGELLGNNGRPAITAEQEISGRPDSRFYIPADLIRTEGNVLAVRYSAHPYRNMSLTKHFPLRFPMAFSFHITQYENIQYRDYIPAFLLVGAIGAAAIFFGALFIYRPADKGSLWLALMFLMVVLQTVSETSRVLVSLSNFGWIARIGIMFLAAYGSGLFLNFYLFYYFDVKRFKKLIFSVTHTVLVSAIVYYSFNFDKMTFAIIVIFIGLAVGVAMYAQYKKKENSLILLIVLLIFFFCFSVGYSLFLNKYFYGAMALLATTLFVIQASVFRNSEKSVSDTKLKVSRLELDLLKRQIQPHFIMNTLTALSEWMISSPEQSLEMIEALGDEFRILNDFVGKDLVPLSEELDLCRAHLKLVSFRRDQSFVLEIDVESQGVTIPPAIFHTLIENALTHNRYTQRYSKFTFIQKEISDKAMELILIAPPGDSLRMNIVPDLAVSERETPKKSGGVGLSYVRKRLQESCDHFTFTDGLDESGGWRSTIIIVNADQGVS